MKGSIRIAKILGIPVYLHWSFGLLVFYVLYIGNSTGMDWVGMGFFALFLMILFLCVVMHEFGHALAARRYGVETQDIILSPIGGIARLKKLPEKPFHEFVVAISGPLVNVVIAILLGTYIYFTDGKFLPDDEQRTVFNDIANLLPMLFLLNIVLVVFNMIPAFPMDGGRILRSLLSIPLGRPKATRIATWIGQGIAIIFVFWGIYNSEFMLGLIGVFVFITASQEYRMVRMDQLLSEHTVADIMRASYTSLSPEQPMQRAAFEMQHGMEKNFLVMDSASNILGVLHELFILEAIKQQDLDAPVAAYMSSTYEAVSKDISIKKIFQRMSKKGYSILPVVEEAALVGVVDVQGVNNFLQLRQKMR